MKKKPEGYCWNCQHRTLISNNCLKEARPNRKTGGVTYSLYVFHHPGENPCQDWEISQFREWWRWMWK